MESEMLKQREQMIVDQSEQITKLQDICKELVEKLTTMTNWCESNDDEIDWHSMCSCKSNDYKNDIDQAKQLIDKAKELIK